MKRKRGESSQSTRVDSSDSEKEMKPPEADADPFYVPQSLNPRLTIFGLFGPRWDSIRPRFPALKDLSTVNDIPPLDIPLVSLPPSYHKRLMENARPWIDAYMSRDLFSQASSGYHMKLFEAWFTPILGAFRGCLHDVPSEGDNIAHRIVMPLTEGTVLLVLEEDVKANTVEDKLAKVISKVESAYQENLDQRPFHPGLPVYAIEVGRHHVRLLSFNGIDFKLLQMYTSWTPLAPREKLWQIMGEVSEYLFSVLLDSFMSYNDAFIAYAEIRGRTRFTPGDGMPAFTLEDLIAQVHRTRLARDVMTSVDISTGSSWERDTRRGMDFFEDGIANNPLAWRWTMATEDHSLVDAMALLREGKLIRQGQLTLGTHGRANLVQEPALENPHGEIRPGTDPPPEDVKAIT